MTQCEDTCVVDLKNIGLEKVDKQKKLKAKFKIIYNTEMDVDIQVFETIKSDTKRNTSSTFNCGISITKSRTV